MMRPTTHGFGHTMCGPCMSPDQGASPGGIGTMPATGTAAAINTDTRPHGSTMTHRMDGRQPGASDGIMQQPQQGSHHGPPDMTGQIDQMDRTDDQPADSKVTKHGDAQQIDDGIATQDGRADQG